MNVKIDSRNPSIANTAGPLGNNFTTVYSGGMISPQILSNEMLAGV